jgi:argininosuccinate lyase
MVETNEDAALWSGRARLEARIFEFTVGDDPQLDERLATYDCIGSAAHARGLAKVGLLSKMDVLALLDALQRLHQQMQNGEWKIAASFEDGHTAIEMALTAQLGDTGKRIHLGRSRNDQALLMMRLYLRDKALSMHAQVAELADALLQLAQKNQEVELPGYTHQRKAMPSSAAMWATGFAEGLMEELHAFDGLYSRLEACPLGAAAGFGVPLPLDREYVARILGFAKVQRSPVDCMNSRGRMELACLRWFETINHTLEKLLCDIALFSTEEFGFIGLPENYTTGSSIMPQKRNPDVVELLRGKLRGQRGAAESVLSISSGLTSSYHRDFQLLKAPTLHAFDEQSQILDLLIDLVANLSFDKNRCAAACGAEIYAAQAAFDLVASGRTFRDAYKEIANQLSAGTLPAKRVSSASHIGGLGDLRLDDVALDVEEIRALWRSESARIDQQLKTIWSMD